MIKMYEGNMKKNFFVFALPLLFSALLSQGYHIIDTVMASRLIGDAAVAAIGSTGPLITLISARYPTHKRQHHIYYDYRRYSITCKQCYNKYREQNKRITQLVASPAKSLELKHTIKLIRELDSEIDEIEGEIK